MVNDGGPCTQLIKDITSSSSEFLPPEILFHPIRVSAGTSVELPVRFQPTALVAAAGTITVYSHDPQGPQSIQVSGNAPAGKLAVTGSNFFGAVKACCTEERTISICNIGDCKLFVSDVAFRRKNKHWKLINNPFPATLHPGSSLAVVIRCNATERYPRPCELMITSDDPTDPTDPIKIIELLAVTIWSDCGCNKCCDKCRADNCDTRHCEPCCCEKWGGDEDGDHWSD